MNEAFKRDPFSDSFNVLRVMGLWRIDTDSAIKRTLYFLFRGCALTYGAVTFMVGIFDLFLSGNDLKKIAFNLCTTTLTSAIFIKNFHLMLLSARINKLRFNLFRDGWELKDPEDLRIKHINLGILQSQRKIFYWAAYILLPAWLLASLSTVKWGPREFPFAAWMPLDPEDNFQFAAGFIYQSIASVYIVTETIQADLGLFALVLQITAHYEILSRKILKIDEMYSGSERCLSTNAEINKTLIDRKTKLILKDCIRRHLVLKSYTTELEFCYNKPMLVQIACGFLLTIVNGLELIVSSMDFSMKLSYQIGYTLIVIGDVLMICLLSDRLASRSQEINTSIYNIAWYEMSNDVRKALLLVMAQKTGQFTASKMFKLDLTTFLGLLKHSYSWLALCSQLLTKN